MDFARYIKFDPWWEESYLRLSIKNYPKIPVFHKFLQIADEYEYSFGPLQESYTKSNNDKRLEIKFIDSANIELAGHNENENYWFYRRFYENSDYTLEIISNLYPNSEYGQEKKVYNDNHWETWSWVKTRDQLAENEHIGDQATELFVFELKYEKNQLISNKLEKREKITKFSCYVYEETEKIYYGDKEIELREKITRDLIEKSEIKKTDKGKIIKKFRDYKGFILETKEVTKPDMKSWCKKLEAKYSSQVLEEFKVEYTTKYSGFNSFKLGEKELKIEWNIVKNHISAEVTIKNNTNMLYYKKFTQHKSNILEIDYFRIAEVHWGSVKDYSNEGSLNMNWKDTESRMHSYYLRQFTILRDKASTSPPDPSLYTKLALIKYDAHYIFDIFETINLYNNSFFSGMTLHIFHQLSPTFSNFTGSTENLCDKLWTYLDDRNRVNENLNQDNFFGVFREAQSINSEVLIEQVIRKEKMLRFIIDGVKANKKNIYSEKFDKGQYLQVQPIIFKLLDSVRIMKSCRSSNIQPSFTVLKSEMIESETLNMFCTVCSTICHVNCQVYSAESNISFSCNEECKVFTNLESKFSCKVCERSCSPKYHMLLKKDINVAEIKYKATEFNEANTIAENYQKEIIESLRTSKLLPFLKFKIAHILIVTKKRLNASKNLQVEYEDWQEVFKVVNNYGA